MLILVKDSLAISQYPIGSRIEVDGNPVMPAKEGPLPNGYSLHKIFPASPVPEGKYIIKTTTEFVNGVWRYVNQLADIIPPTPEELREQLPQLSMVDFRRKLRATKVIQREGLDDLDGIFEEDILDKISLIADKDLAAEARDYFLYAQYIERINPWVDILGNMFGLTPEQIDEAWV